MILPAGEGISGLKTSRLGMESKKDGRGIEECGRLMIYGKDI